MIDVFVLTLALVIMSIGRRWFSRSDGDGNGGRASGDNEGNDGRGEGVNMFRGAEMKMLADGESVAQDVLLSFGLCYRRRVCV